MGHPDVEEQEESRSVAIAMRGESLPAASMDTTPAMAVAVQAKAAVEARYLMALQRPRNWDAVRVKLLDACKRPRFAETARYSKPVGGKQIIGPSIRFAEEALRAMGNAMAEAMVMQEDSDQRILRVSVTDLESNLTYPQDVVVRKEVERKKLKEGQSHRGKRLNSYGDTVYLVEATDDELLVKQNALTSKSLRTSALRVLPSDILEECMEAIEQTVADRDAKDPAGARKRLIDLFHKKGIGPEDLVTFLGHPIEQITPAELGELKLHHTAITEGESTWAAIMETRWNDLTDSKTTAAKTQARAADLKQRIAGKKPDQGKPETEEERVRREDAAEAAKERAKAPQREPGEE